MRKTQAGKRTKVTNPSVNAGEVCDDVYMEANVDSFHAWLVDTVGDNTAMSNIQRQPLIAYLESYALQVIFFPDCTYNARIYAIDVFICRFLRILDRTPLRSTLNHT